MDAAAAAQLAADACAEAEARDGDADVRLVAVQHAVADLYALHAGTYARGDVGPPARAALAQLCARIGAVCAEFRELGSGPSPLMQAVGEWRDRAQRAEARLRHLDLARDLLDTALAVDPADWPEAMTASLRDQMQRARDALANEPRTRLG